MYLEILASKMPSEEMYHLLLLDFSCSSSCSQQSLPLLLLPVAVAGSFVPAGVDRTHPFILGEPWTTGWSRVNICTAALVSSHSTLLQIAILGDGQCRMCMGHMVFSPQSTVALFFIQCNTLLYVCKFNLSFGSRFYLLGLEARTYLGNLILQ